MEFINIGPVYNYKKVDSRGTEMRWVVAKPKRKNKDDTNDSGCDVHMYPQRAIIPPQGLDRVALTVEATSGPHCQILAIHWCYFTSHGFTWLSKKHFVKAN